VINGAGVRKRVLFFKVYAIGLYLPQKSLRAAADAINAKGAKRVAIVTLRDTDRRTVRRCPDRGPEEQPRRGGAEGTAAEDRPVPKAPC
jgi:hypothetical protein